MIKFQKVAELNIYLELDIYLWKPEYHAIVEPRVI